MTEQIAVELSQLPLVHTFEQQSSSLAQALPCVAQGGPSLQVPFWQDKLQQFASIEQG